MKQQAKLSRSLMIVGLVTAVILAVPLLAMQFTPEVNWSFFDFIVMGGLIFGTGSSYVLLTRTAPNIVYRIAMAMMMATTFLMIWANLAVGLIGSGPNAGNLLYMAVVLVVVLGTIGSHFRPAGMERAMYATALALILHTLVALLAGMQEYPGSSVVQIVGLNGFFTGLYLIAGSLFRYASTMRITQKA